jgi:ribosomal protein S18 acetylase RimI-like enzyme
MTPMTVRNAAPGDRAFMLELGLRTAPTSMSQLRPAPTAVIQANFERLLEMVLGQSHFALVAERAGVPIGFTLVLDAMPDEVSGMPQAFVAYLGVDEASRGLGVGALLMRAAEDEARRRGLPYMALMVTQENAAARSLYKRAGYKTERRLLTKKL